MGRNLENSVAIITGASSGIGREAAILLAKKKARVVIAARREDRLREVEEKIIGLKGEVFTIPTDVSDKAQVERMVEKTLERFGRVDILVNNAGFGIQARISDVSTEDMREIIDVNLMGTLHAIKAALPAMRKQGGGHIINVSSIAGKRGFPFIGAYCATKFAMNAVSEALRVELEGTGIHVSLIYPITTETEFFDVMKNKTGKRVEPPKMFRQSAGEVAAAIVRCAENPKSEVFPFPAARLLGIINSAAPGVLDFMLRMYYKYMKK